MCPSPFQAGERRIRSAQTASKAPVSNAIPATDDAREEWRYRRPGQTDGHEGARERADRQINATDERCER